MPRVPTYDGFKTAPASLPRGRFTAPNAPATGAAQLQDAANAAQTATGAIADYVREAQEKANRTVAKDVENGFQDEIDGVLHDPGSGFLALQGGNAMHGYEATQQALETAKRKAMSRVKNDRVRELAGAAVDSRFANAMRTVQRHSARESRRYTLQTSDARAVKSLEAAAKTYDDDAMFAQASQIARGEAAAQGEEQGWSRETFERRAREYVTAGQKMRYSAWKLADPVAALRHFQTNIEQIAPGDRDAIGSDLYRAAAPELAQTLVDADRLDGPAGGPDDAPRGIRNHNPGNLIRGGEQWRGEVAGNDARFATFSSPEAGIRAMARTLRTYQTEHGINTLQGVAARWAPAGENDPAAYAETLAEVTGIAHDEPLDLANAETLNAVVRAIVAAENGEQPYSDEQIAAGIGAMDSDNVPTTTDWRTDPTAPTGVATVDNLPVHWRERVVRKAAALGKAGQARLRGDLESRTADAVAAYERGIVPDEAPSEREFLAAYGQAEGVERYRQFLDAQDLGRALDSVKELPTREIDALLEAEQPSPGDGFAYQQRNFEILQRAAERVRKARQHDPVAYAAAMDGDPYQLPSMQRNASGNLDLAGTLSARLPGAQAAARDFGTPLRLLTNNERTAVADHLAALDPRAAVDQLGGMRSRLGAAGFRTAMSEIAPVQPALAAAGIYAGRNRQDPDGDAVAPLILQGMRVLNPSADTGTSKPLVKMPAESMLMHYWSAETGAAFRGKPETNQLFMQTARAVYAAVSAREGDYSGEFNRRRWQKAIRAATGGVERHNGVEIVMPYGMKYGDFKDALAERFDALAAEGRTGSATVRELRRLPLENVGDGRFLVRRGAGYLFDEGTGQPMVIDLGDD